MRMAENNDDTVTVGLACLQPTPDQCRADSLILSSGQHSHWSKSQGWDGQIASHDRQVAEQDVADDLALVLSDERQSDETAISQSIHKPGLAVLSEGQPV